jgi:pyruvate/2-oxoglutarate dehydrogenase complex dihydrolipoamide dehydrogenase (E3) component
MHVPNDVLHADVLVIGFGKGGKTVAATMDGQGKHVILVEQSDRTYGGTCPNVGCVPTKALVHHVSACRTLDAAPHRCRRGQPSASAMVLAGG